jgi:hypothetical protein
LTRMDRGTTKFNAEMGCGCGTGDADVYTASNLDRLGTDVGSALVAMKAEKSRLVRLKLERQAELHALYDRAQACFELLNTKPEAQRAVFTWHQRSLLPQSLAKLKEVRLRATSHGKPPRTRGGTPGGHRRPSLDTRPATRAT